MTAAARIDDAGVVPGVVPSAIGVGVVECSAGVEVEDGVTESVWL